MVEKHGEGANEGRLNAICPACGCRDWEETSTGRIWCPDCRRTYTKAEFF